MSYKSKWQIKSRLMVHGPGTMELGHLSDHRYGALHYENAGFYRKCFPKPKI